MEINQTCSPTNNNPGLHQQYIFLSKYARWKPEYGRRETYPEACNRTIDYLTADVAKQTGYRLDELEQLHLLSSMIGQSAFPSMRTFQMAGPSAMRCNIANYNCSYLPIDSLRSFSELLYILMQGTGAGFSVEQRYVSRLPEVKKEHRTQAFFHCTVKDTTEGWCNALLEGIEGWMEGHEVTFDYSQVRKKGERLATKGGWASGPESLQELLSFVRGVISKYWVQGGRLSSLDCHDIACKIGEIVVVGGVRRSALLSLSDLNDTALRGCKQGEFWNTAPWRMMSNNSAVYEERPTWKEFTDEWQSLRDSGSGERGIWNRGGYAGAKPTRRSSSVWGVNPCGEIALRPRGLCNLSRAVCRRGDNLTSLEAKVRTAAIFGTLQSALTRFGYLGSQWSQNCREERLLGVSLDGAMDCLLLRSGNVGGTLRHLKEVAVLTNQEWSGKLGINRSAAVTTMQPGGNGAQLLDCASGLHPRFAPYYIRRYRANLNDPLARLAIDRGVPWHRETGEAEGGDRVVFDFPIASPKGCLTRHSVDAFSQFNRWLEFKQSWTEHNPSVTIYVKPEEWDALGRVVWGNWANVGGLSFLPFDGGVYPLMPYEEVSESTYTELKRKFEGIDFQGLGAYEAGTDSTNFVGELSCVGGACEL